MEGRIKPFLRSYTKSTMFLLGVFFLFSYEMCEHIDLPEKTFWSGLLQLAAHIFREFGAVAFALVLLHLSYEWWIRDNEDNELSNKLNDSVLRISEIMSQHATSLAEQMSYRIDSGYYSTFTHAPVPAVFSQGKDICIMNTWLDNSSSCLMNICESATVRIIVGDPLANFSKERAASVYGQEKFAEIALPSLEIKLKELRERGVKVNVLKYEGTIPFPLYMTEHSLFFGHFLPRVDSSNAPHYAFRNETQGYAVIRGVFNRLWDELEAKP